MNFDEFLGKNLHEESQKHGPNVKEKLGKGKFREPQNQNSDGKEDENKKSRVRGLSNFDDISNFFQEPFDFLSVLILFARIKDKAYPFEAFNPLLIFSVLTGKEAAG